MLIYLLLNHEDKQTKKTHLSKIRLDIFIVRFFYIYFLNLNTNCGCFIQVNHLLYY